MTPLAQENLQVLNLVQALLGAISPNFRAVSLVYGERLSLHFVLERDDATDREEIEDVAFEFEALQQAAVDIRTVVIVSDRPIRSSETPGRQVYRRREA